MEVLHLETPDFISPDLWPTNSPDLNPVDHQIWAVMHQRSVYVAPKKTSTTRFRILSVIVYTVTVRERRHISVNRPTIGPI